MSFEPANLLVAILAAFSGVALIAAYASTRRNRARRKRAEAQLLESRRHFELLVEGAIGYAIIMLSPDGVVRSWNPGAERMFGYTEAEIIGQPFGVFFTPSDRERQQPRSNSNLRANKGIRVTIAGICVRMAS